MNDLAERALQGLDTARRAIAGRPVAGLAALGVLAASLVVLVGARIGAAPSALPLNSWFGLLPRAGYRVVGILPGLVMLAGILVLAALWLVVLRLVRCGRLGERAVWTLAAAWAVPFAIGPPLLSTDAYSYVARGLLARDGLSPYHHGPGAVSDDRLVNAIDPVWRGAHSTGGPLSSALEHLLATVAAGNPVGTLVLLRALAVVSTVAIGRLAMDLGAPGRARALAITVLNPAVLLFIVSAAHLEGLFAVLLLAALVRAGHRRWSSAIVLAALAAGLKPVALVAVAALVIAHAVGRVLAWRIALRDSVLGLATLAAATLVVPYGLAWITNLGTLSRAHTPYAPASVISNAISLVVPSASFDDLAIGGRIAAGLAAAIAVGYLLWTVRNRPLERTIGYALLALGVLGPAVHPWFLLWGLLCLAPSAARTLRDWVITLSLAACVLAPAGFTTRTGEVVTGVAFSVLGVLLAIRVAARTRRDRAEQQAVSAGA